MQTLPHEKKIAEYEEKISELRSGMGGDSPFETSDLLSLEKKLEALKVQVYSKLSPWERVMISRHPERPRAKDYIDHICGDFMELHGDRTFADDAAIVAGFATIGGQKVALIAQEKGNDTASRMERNFGMPHPEGYRKALRVMKLAEKFGLPIVSLIDTPGAYAGLSAEERGQGAIIAQNLYEMAQLETPIVICVIGEGASGGALAIGVGDVVGMLEHAYYSVISPESCSTILWGDASKKEQAAEMLKMHPEMLLELGLIDEILQEPRGGAHHDPETAYAAVKHFVTTHVAHLLKTESDTLLEKRYAKLRKMGRFTT
jgi:acetyl-CoA carboxylase carboxyl transferase subunit alpha